MKVLKKETYKGLEIEVYFVEVDNGFQSSWMHLSSSNPENGFTRSYKTIDESLNDLKAKIDDFFITTPKDYEELTKAIESTLIWTGYEDCHLDETLVKILIENFNKLKP